MPGHLPPPHSQWASGLTVNWCQGSPAQPKGTCVTRRQWSHGLPPVASQESDFPTTSWSQLLDLKSQLLKHQPWFQQMARVWILIGGTNFWSPFFSENTVHVHGITHNHLCTDGMLNFLGFLITRRETQTHRHVDMLVSNTMMHSLGACLCHPDFYPSTFSVPFWLCGAKGFHWFSLVLHTALMVPVCHGFGGKVPSYGEWKAEHQGEELYCIYMWSLCGVGGVGVCVSDWVQLCVSQYLPDRFRFLFG